MRRKVAFGMIGLLVGLAAMAFGLALSWAGTCAQNFIGEYYMDFTWSGNGTISCTATSRLDGQIMWVETRPTATPTDNYDVALTDSVTTRDLSGGAAVDRDNATIEIVQPKIGASAVSALPVNGLIKLDITNQAVPTASGVVRVYYKKGF